MLSIDTQGGYGTGLCIGGLIVAYGPERYGLTIAIGVGVLSVIVALARIGRRRMKEETDRC